MKFLEHLHQDGVENLADIFETTGDYSNQKYLEF